MNILFDSQIFSTQNFGGISTYFAYVYKYLNELPEVHASLPVLLSSNVNLDMVEPSAVKRFLRSIDIKGKTKLQVILNTLYSKMMIKTKKFDVFHPTYYDPYFLPYLNERPFVVTVFDMVHELFPDKLNKSTVAQNKSLLLQKASKIIAISESTKKDIVTLQGIPPEKISIVYMAGDNINTVINDPSSIEIVLPKEYILYVGDRKAFYKNFTNFVKAVAPILRKSTTLHLVTVGGGLFTQVEKNLISELGIDKKVICVPLTNKAPIQRFFYEKALLFVYPSLYEGFGIPLIEAFLCNCPTVASNKSCFPEIGLDATLYFDPDNIDDMTHIMQKALTDITFREKAKKIGQLRAKDFTWKQSAEQSTLVYKSLV